MDEPKAVAEENCRTRSLTCLKRVPKATLSTVVEEATTEETESVASEEPVAQIAEASEAEGDTVARISTQNVDESTQENVETATVQVATAVETTTEAVTETATAVAIETEDATAEISETPAVEEAVEDTIEVTEAASEETVEEAAEVEIAKAPEQPIQEEEAQQEETPTVMIADVSGVKIVSKAPASAENPEIFLDTISYDEEGALTLAGRGVPSGLVRLYLNNAVIGETTTDALGAWSYDASAIEPGVYTLRIDQLNADASKVSGAHGNPVQTRSAFKTARTTLCRGKPRTYQCGDGATGQYPLGHFARTLWSGYSLCAGV